MYFTGNAVCIYGILETNDDMVMNYHLLQMYNISVYVKSTITPYGTQLPLSTGRFVYGIPVSSQSNTDFENVNFFASTYGFDEPQLYMCIDTDVQKIIDDEFDLVEYMPIQPETEYEYDSFEYEYENTNSVQEQYNLQQRQEYIKHKWVLEDLATPEQSSIPPLKDVCPPTPSETFYRQVDCFEDIYTKYTDSVY